MLEQNKKIMDEMYAKCWIQRAKAKQVYIEPGTNKGVYE
jgi:hypothetical protein